MMMMLGVFVERDSEHRVAAYLIEEDMSNVDAAVEVIGNTQCYG